MPSKTDAVFRDHSLDITIGRNQGGTNPPLPKNTPLDPQIIHFLVLLDLNPTPLALMLKMLASPEI